MNIRIVKTFDRSIISYKIWQFDEAVYKPADKITMNTFMP
jgi:hypothetical protein